MIYYLKLFILILIIIIQPLNAIIQPSKGQISIGVSRTSTDRQTPEYQNQNGANLPSQTYDPGMGFYLSYGLSDNLNIYTKI